MLTAVSFYAKSDIRSIEIQNEFVYGKLTPEFNAGDAPISQHAP
jgi:hypothetical protein